MGNSLTFPVPEHSRTRARDFALGSSLAPRRHRTVSRRTVPPLASSTWRSRERFTVTKSGFGLTRLPDAFSGLRVVQISDIHHGLFLPQEWLAEAVRRQTGSIRISWPLPGTSSPIRGRNRPAAEILGRLRARYGVFAVLGNHDFRVDADAITLALRRQRIEVLRNQHVALGFGGSSLYLAGVDDYGYGADVRQAMRGIPRDAATVLLAHNPRIISLGRAPRRKPGSLRTHPRRASEHPAVGNCVWAFARAMRYKIGWDRLGTDANLRQPGHWNDRSAVAAALPGRNHSLRTASGSSGAIQAAAGLTAKTHACQST